METNPRAPDPYKKEIIIRTASNFSTEVDVKSFVDLAKKYHIDVISLLVKQDEDAFIPSGNVFYRSEIAPIAYGYQRFDVLKTLINFAHKDGIMVRAWIPQFHDQAAVKKHPEWQMISYTNGEFLPYSGSDNQEYFVNPFNEQVQDYELSIIKEVTEKYDVDGIMLDWIRFDDFNMDLSQNTRRQYQALNGIDPVTIDFSIASPQREKWNDFRTTEIQNYVRKVRLQTSKNITVGIYILPPDFIEVGQDASKFNSIVDFLAPMCYFRDWGFDVNWVWENCLSSTHRKSGPAVILPTMDSHLSDAEYKLIFDHIHDDYPEIKMISWFFHEKWTEEMLKRIEYLSTW